MKATFLTFWAALLCLSIDANAAIHPKLVMGRYVEIGEGTHMIIMEKNRMQLFQAVQQFLDERVIPTQ